MKCLVTGGAGFIGSNLVEMLVGNGDEVTVLDNLFLGTEKNLEKVRKDVTFVKGDIRNQKLMVKLSRGVDCIFHLAAASSSPMFRESLKETLEVNIDGTIHVLDAAKINGVRRVVYASTSSLYGNNKPPLTEDMALKPVNFYASSKLMKEHLAALFGIEFGVETVGLRFGSVYGLHEEAKGIYANLVSQFMWAIREGKQPVVYGDGGQKRDFTYAKDICLAAVLAASAKEKMIGEVFNVATGKQFSFNEMIGILNEKMGGNVRPKYIKNPVPNYIHEQGLDIGKITRALRYKPRYTLEAGISEMLEAQP